MAFTSLSFLLFLGAVLFLFVTIPDRLRWLLLLAASYLFYACLGGAQLLPVLLLVTSLNFGAGLLLRKSASAQVARRWLWAGIAANLSFLFAFKYLPFAAAEANFLSDLLFAVKPFPVRQFAAIGVSYYVFQGISYLIDVYLEILEPERHFGVFALYLAFFPKLVQGPIERGASLLPQLRRLDACRRENLRDGIHLFLWGCFKKVVVADRIASLVDPVYASVHSSSGLSLLVATYLFAFQIYFDFSGYTDMALGIARLFNVRLTQNFNAPYLATSIADFWRRWHISFSSWILDYLFKPLQMQLRDWPRWGTPLALLLTFIASGIWHGASWCFLAWGALHGCYLAVSTLVRRHRQKLVKYWGLQKSVWLQTWQRCATFHLVCFSWIFFRAESLGDAFYVVRQIADLPHAISRSAPHELAQQLLLGKSPQDSLVVLFFMLAAAAAGALDRKWAPDPSRAGELLALSRVGAALKGVAYGVFAYLIAFSGASAQGFLYTRF